VNAPFRWLRQIWTDALGISGAVFKITIPAILAVRVLEELGGVELLSRLLGPTLELVGLPSRLAIVWATTMLANIYAGLILLANESMREPLSVAELTTLGGMMLVAHSLPVEIAIAAKAGVRLSIALVTRIGGALAFGAMLHAASSMLGIWQEPHAVLWRPEPRAPSLMEWIALQIWSLGTVFVTILLLVALLRVLKRIGVERALQRALRPVLAVLGIGDAAVTMTIVGMTLGLSYGGGLVMHEARAGGLTARDVFGSLALMGLVHGLIEDSLLLLLAGADFWGIVAGRLIFGIAVVWLSMRWLDSRSASLRQRILADPTAR
jgi:hypothetical protein